MTVSINLDPADAEWLLTTLASLAETLRESLFYHAEAHPTGCPVRCPHQDDVAELKRVERLLERTRVALTSANPRVKAGS
jgi:hypothetical protein